MLLRDLIAILEDLAPPSLAETWDNTGLLLGDRKADVTRVMTCLTLSPDVAAEAVAAGAKVVVTHHPLLFKAVQRITADTVEGRTIHTLLGAGIAVYSPHTAWDNAPLGINQQLAELCGLEEIAPLRRSPGVSKTTLVTFVPKDDLDTVRKALWDAGCGKIGAYKNCSFYVHGTGSFYGTSGTDPAVGQAGRQENVEEARLEVLCPTSRLDAGIRALRTSHPYEEPAFDVYPLHVQPGDTGVGRFGRLPSPMPLSELAMKIGMSLKSTGLQLAGDPTMIVERLGIACGAAAEFWKDAQRAGCQALLTGEARFHAALECREAGFGLIVAGHYATERHGMERLAALLAERCPGIEVTASATERDPLTTA